MRWAKWRNCRIKILDILRRAHTTHHLLPLTRPFREYWLEKKYFIRLRWGIVAMTRGGKKVRVHQSIAMIVWDVQGDGLGKRQESKVKCVPKYFCPMQEYNNQNISNSSSNCSSSSSSCSSSSSSSSSSCSSSSSSSSNRSNNYYYYYYYKQVGLKSRRWLV